MAIIALSQAVMGWLQFEEARKKRLEAEEVLSKARVIFTRASTSAMITEMTNRKANEVLETTKLTSGELNKIRKEVEAQKTAPIDTKRLRGVIDGGTF